MRASLTGCPKQMWCVAAATVLAARRRACQSCRRAWSINHTIAARSRLSQTPAAARDRPECLPCVYPFSSSSGVSALLGVILNATNWSCSPGLMQIKSWQCARKSTNE